MSVDSLEFVDTNVLVYAFDPSAGEKHVLAVQLLEKLWESRAGCLSVQVLQEFYVTVTRKVAQPLMVSEARDRIQELSVWKVFTPNAIDVIEAISLQQEAKLSFWDAMIVLSASKLGCATLWSEDLSTDQVVKGVQVRSPFAL